MKDKIYNKISTEINPEFAGWYNTDKGELFWFQQEKVWSCRDEYVSDEYPKFWYKELAQLKAEAEKEVSDENDFVQYVTNLLYMAHGFGEASEGVNTPVFDEWVEQEMVNMGEFYASHNLLASKVTDTDIENYAKGKLNKDKALPNSFSKMVAEIWFIQGAKAHRDNLIKKG